MPRFLAAALGVLLTLGSVPPASAQGAERGAHARLVQVEVDPPDVPRWEAAVSALAEVARRRAVGGRVDWRLYRAGPARYFGVFVSDSLGDVATPARFAAVLAGADSALAAAWAAGVDSLLATRFRLVTDGVHERVAAWSTARTSSPRAHPKGRLTACHVRPGSQAAFDAALRDYVALLRRARYPYPLEGFRWRLGTPAAHYTVVFPDAWDAFHGQNELSAGLQRVGLGRRGEQVLQALAAACLRIEQHDLDFAPELSP